MQASQDPPVFERYIQAFLAREGTDIVSQAAVFNLDHAFMDVFANMEVLALRPHDLTHAGFVLLMTVWVTGPRETRELAAVLRVTKGAIVGAVNTLERRGLVQRDRTLSDRRLVRVELTDAGRELIVRVQKDWRALEVEVTSALTLNEKRTLAALCRKMGHSARVLRHSRNGAQSPALPDPEAILDKLMGISS